MIPVALASAPNGGRKTKADHPELPITAEEIGRAAVKVVEAGACMMHVHVRRPDGGHTLDAAAYAAAFAAIRSHVGRHLVLQMTSESLGVYTPAEQMAAVEAVGPEYVSLAVRELCPTADEEVDYAAFLGRLRARRIPCQHILYDPADCARLMDLHGRGVIPGEALAVLFVLGRYTKDQKSAPADLVPFLPHATGPVADWMVCAFGADEGACAVTAGALGGGARVGFENNLLMVDGSIAPANADLVDQARVALSLIGRRPMTSAEYRERLATLL